MDFLYNTPLLNKINITPVKFRANTGINTSPNIIKKDGYTTSPIYENFVDKNTLTQIAKNNPNITNILKTNHIPLNVNIQELEKLKTGHLMDTRVTAAKIYSSLPQELKQQVNLMNLQQAAMLHDYGKVLIPEKILNKKGTLTPQEKQIMDLHPELGYELLKPQGVNEHVLNLIKYHHQNPLKTGYPSVPNDYQHEISSEILTAADKYTALREQRSYKNAMTKEDALKLLKRDVSDGILSEEVYNALEKNV